MLLTDCNWGFWILLNRQSHLGWVFKAPNGMLPSIFHCWLNDLCCADFPIPLNHKEKEAACHCSPFCCGGFEMRTVAEICVPWCKMWQKTAGLLWLIHRVDSIAWAACVVEGLIVLAGLLTYRHQFQPAPASPNSTGDVRDARGVGWPYR